jgi:hypothetical protein
MELLRKKKHGRKSGLFALLLPLAVLNGCASGNTYTIRLEEGASSTYEFGEAYHEKSWGIYYHDTRASYVSAAMLKDFYTNVITFGMDLPVQVNYEGQSLETTYQVSSVYDLDENYTVSLFREELEVTKVRNPDKTLTEFEIPSSISTLPEPLNNWPVTAWSASFGGFSALKKVYLSKGLKSFAPSPWNSTIALFPHSAKVSGESGALDYQGDFLLIDDALCGIRSSVEGTLSLPTDVSSIKDNAFAASLPGVILLNIPANYSDPDFSLTAHNLPNNRAFVMEKSGSTYAEEGFLFHNDGSDVTLRGIPEGLCQSGTFLSIPYGLTRFILTSLEGFDAPGSAMIILPSSVTSFSAPIAIDNTTLSSLEFTSSSVVKTNALSMKNLPSSLKEIKVPSSLLESYKADSNWGKLSNLLTA